MKKHFLLFVLSLTTAIFCFAQEEEPPQKPVAPKWVSAKGYWVVESNLHNRKSNTVYFYNLENVLVYKEKLDGIKIKTNKAKVCMRLKNALEQAVTVWEATHVTKENETLVAAALKK